MQNLLKLFLAWAIIITLFCSSSAAQDTTVQRFKPGTLISADMINEMFDRVYLDIANVLIGEWNYENWGSSSATPDVPYCSGTISIRSLTDISTTGRCNQMTQPIIKITPIGRRAFTFNYTSGGTTFTRSRILSEVSPNLLTFNDNDGVEVMRRVTSIPGIPTDLTATINGTSVTLNWVSNSNETGYKIFRKDTLTGDFKQIALSSTKTYVDTLSSTPGQYWYRIKATNSIGDSLGSNEATVIVK